MKVRMIVCAMLLAAGGVLAGRPAEGLEREEEGTRARVFEYMMPEDLAGGMEVVLRVRVGANELSAERFEARVLSAWGAYRYAFTRKEAVVREPGPDAETVRTRRDKVPHSHGMNYEAPEYKDWVDLQGQVSAAGEGGKDVVFAAEFADRVVTFDMHLERAQDFSPIATVRNFRYGPHERNVFDVYLPKDRGEGPFPVVVRIHGGGWTGGDKRGLQEAVPLLGRGIAYVSINYRLDQHARADGVIPIMAAPLLDAARALQTLRHHAREFKIDKTRIGLTGGSAGGYTSLWLGLHDDLAEPESEDPVARESTRVTCVASTVPMCQFPPWLNLTGIPERYREVAALYRERNAGFWSRHFGVTEQEVRGAKPGSELRRAIDSFSPQMQVTKDDPPLLLDYLYWDWYPVTYTKRILAHHPINSVPIKSAYEKLGKECILLGVGLPAPETYYPGPAGEPIKPKEANTRYRKGEAIVSFLCEHLLK
jgi:hypothetical protein